MKIDLFILLIDQILMIDQYEMYWFSLIGSSKQIKICLKKNLSRNRSSTLDTIKNHTSAKAVELGS